jgi:hypothetical protein
MSPFLFSLVRQDHTDFLQPHDHYLKKVSVNIFPEKDDTHLFLEGTPRV